MNKIRATNGVLLQMFLLQYLSIARKNCMAANRWCKNTTNDSYSAHRLSGLFCQKQLAHIGHYAHGKVSSTVVNKLTAYQ
jgi:hypothetical protein